MECKGMNFGHDTKNAKSFTMQKTAMPKGKLAKSQQSSDKLTIVNHSKAKLVSNRANAVFETHSNTWRTKKERNYFTLFYPISPLVQRVLSESSVDRANIVENVVTSITID